MVCKTRKERGGNKEFIRKSFWIYYFLVIMALMPLSTWFKQVIGYADNLSFLCDVKKLEWMTMLWKCSVWICTSSPSVSNITKRLLSEHRNSLQDYASSPSYGSFRRAKFLNSTIRLFKDNYSSKRVWVYWPISLSRKSTGWANSLWPILQFN
jgi:hypothetical protein